MSWISKALDEKESMTPKQGFNVVGLDDSGPPDDWGLYLIGNFDTEEAANQMLEKVQSAEPEAQFYIYPARSGERASKFMGGREEG